MADREDPRVAADADAGAAAARQAGPQAAIIGRFNVLAAMAALVGILAGICTTQVRKRCGFQQGRSGISKEVNQPHAFPQLSRVVGSLSQSPAGITVAKTESTKQMPGGWSMPRTCMYMPETALPFRSS